MFESEYGTPVRVVYGPTRNPFGVQIEKGAQIDVIPSSVEELIDWTRRDLCW